MKSVLSMLLIQVERVILDNSSNKAISGMRTRHNGTFYIKVPEGI